MAGTIIADYIRADANRISLNVGNTVIASINALGILSNTGNVMISSSGVFDANNITYNGSTIVPSGRFRSSMQPAGSVLQVVQTVKTDTFTMTGVTYTDVTGMSVSITPTSATSKIMVLVNGVLGHNNYHSRIRLVRNATAIALGDVNGVRPQATVAASAYSGNSVNDQYHMIPFSINFLDSPATTSATTYKIQLAGYSSLASYINRGHAWQNNTDYDGAPISTITVMEIAV
jgi:hypothetical protein